MNKNLSAYSPSSRTNVGSDAIAVGAEVGYNLFSQIAKLCEQQKFYLFGRYDYYDTMYKTEGGILDEMLGRQKVTVGINYYPETDWHQSRLQRPPLQNQYNNEPTLSIGITYSGFFL